ncbi:MAG: hypothetical protein WCQ99_15180 [Pseudomonadota bacterium]
MYEQEKTLPVLFLAIKIIILEAKINPPLTVSRLTDCFSPVTFHGSPFFSPLITQWIRALFSFIYRQNTGKQVINIFSLTAYR